MFSCFWSYMPLWDTCTKWSQIALNTKGSKAPNLLVTTTLKSQILLLFALWLAVFELQAILRHMRQMTPWTLKGQRYPIYMLQLPLSSKFQSISLYAGLFVSYNPVWDKWAERAQNDLEHWKVKDAPTYMLQLPRVTQFLSMISHFEILANFLFVLWAQCIRKIWIFFETLNLKKKNKL